MSKSKGANYLVRNCDLLLCKQSKSSFNLISLYNTNTIYMTFTMKHNYRYNLLRIVRIKYMHLQIYSHIYI